MAADGTIFVEVDPTGAVVGAKRVKKSLDDMGRSIDKTGKQAGRARKNIGELAKGLVGPLGLAAGAAAVALAFKSVITVAASFEKSISNLSAITGATGEDLQFLSDQAKSFGETTTASAIEVAEAFALVGSAKPELLESGEALASVTKDAITLAEASGLTLPESVKALTGSLNQFSAGAEEANRFINVLAAGAKLGSSVIPDLSQALKVAGTVAAGAGLSFEETVAGIEALAEAELKGAEAGTNFRNVLIRLNKIGVEELSPSVVGLSQALKNLEATQLSGLSVLERNLKLEKLFGPETLAAAQALLVRAQRVEDLTKAVKGTNVAQEQASINTANFEGQSKKLDAAFIGLQIALGENFLPLMTQLASDLAVTIRLFNDGIKAVVAFGQAIGDALGTTDSLLRKAQTQTARVIEAQLAGELEILQALEDPERIAEQSKLIVGLQKALEAAKQREKPDVPKPKPTGGTTTPGAVDTSKADKAAADAASAAAKAAEEQASAFASLFAELKPLEQAKLDLAEADKVLVEQARLQKIGFEELQDLQSELNEAFSEAINPVEALNARLAEEIELGKLTAEQKQIQARVQQELNDLKAAGVEDVESLRDAITKEVTEIQALNAAQQAQGQEQEVVNEALERQKTLLEEIRGPQEDMVNTLADLNQLLADDAITLDEFNDKLEQLRLETLNSQTTVEAGFERGFIKAQANLNDFASLSEKIVKDSFQGMEDGIVSFVKTGKVSFAGLVDSILEDLVRLAAKKSIVNALGQPPGKTGGGSGLFGFLGSLGGGPGTSPGGPPGLGQNTPDQGVGQASAGIGFAAQIASLFGGAADGAIFRQPSVSAVAERGPEAVIPLKGGKVPVEVSESPRPPNVIQNTFNIQTPDPASFKRSVGQIGLMMSQGMQSSLARNG